MPGPARRRAGFVRRLAFSLIPLTLLLGGLEVVLRAIGFVGHPDRTVSWCREHAAMTRTLFPPVVLDGQPEVVAGPAFAGHPRPFPVVKSAGTRRIFVLGSSAAHGYGFSRNGSFAGRLEELLSEAWPEREVQVVNGGAIAASSQQVLALGKEILQNLDPDLIVVYSGHNELLEWFDWRQYLPAPAHRAFVAGLRLNLRLSHLRSYLLLRELLPGGDEGRWGQTRYSDDEALPWSRRARMRDPDRAWAREAFAHNLRRLVAEARAAGVPVILSTVAPNEAMEPGWIPDDGEALPPEAAAALARAQDLLRGPVPDAAALAGLAREACAAWPEARCHHRWGMLLRDAGFPVEARAELSEAILLDEFPNRAKPFINETVRAVAQREGALLLDGEALLRARSPDGILGFDQIFDHCHPTLQAHWALAGGLAKLILAEVWPGRLGDAGVDARVAAGIAAMDAQRGDSDRIEGWLEVAWREDTPVYDADPESEGRARWQAAEQEARAFPDDPARQNRLGLLAFHHFQADCRPERGPCLQEAADAFRQALALDPGTCAARANLGWLLVQAGRRGEGRAALAEAVACEGAGGPASALLARVDGWGRPTGTSAPPSR